ncbi:MAG: PKD-like domain-containing protein [Bacteroidota bacterium]
MTYTFEGSIGLTCINPSRQVVTVTLHPVPAAVAPTSMAGSACSDVSFNIDPQAYIANSVGSTFTWNRSLVGGLSVVSGTAAGSGNITGTLSNVTNTTLNATYMVTPTGIAGGCAGTSYSIVIPILSKR